LALWSFKYSSGRNVLICACLTHKYCSINMQTYEFATFSEINWNRVTSSGGSDVRSYDIACWILKKSCIP
jgi:hypothetical protein